MLLNYWWKFCFSCPVRQKSICLGHSIKVFDIFIMLLLELVVCYEMTIFRSLILLINIKLISSFETRYLFWLLWNFIKIKSFWFSCGFTTSVEKFISSMLLKIPRSLFWCFQNIWVDISLANWLLWLWIFNFHVFSS